MSNNPGLFQYDETQENEPFTSAITLRDLFAAFALAGWLANRNNVFDDDEYSTPIHLYDIADALLAERAKEQNEAE